MLIPARAPLGVAGATLMPSTLALISNMFPDPHQRDVASWGAGRLDLIGVALSLGTILPIIAAGVSKYHFLRCFAATYRKTPALYLSERRIERAQDLLRATNLTVTEVCLLVGYTSLGSFSTRFTRLVGTAPSAYQAKYAERGAPRIPGCFIFMHGLSDTTRLSDRTQSSAISEKPIDLGAA